MSGQPITRPPDASTAPVAQPIARPLIVGAGAPTSIQPSAPIAGVPSILTELGFVTGTQRRRLFITSEGAPKVGKTHFLWTMPGPIALIDFDRGAEGVIDRVKDANGVPLNMYGQPIMRKTIPFAEFDEGGKTMSAVELSAARESYQLFKHLVSQIIRSGAVRTLSIDTGGAAYALAQAARFGQLAQVGEVPPSMWTSMQMEFENIFLQAYDAGCNVLVTHRQGSKFKGLAGEKELKGYKNMPFVSQVHLVHQQKTNRVPVDPMNPQSGTREQTELSIRIGECRQRFGLKGCELPILLLGEDENGIMQSMGGRFVDVATAVFPNTKVEDWI